MPFIFVIASEAWQLAPIPSPIPIRGKGVSPPHYGGGFGWGLRLPRRYAPRKDRAKYCHCERSEAIFRPKMWGDCHVATLLAMTGRTFVIASEAKQSIPTHILIIKIYVIKFTLKCLFLS